MGVACVGARYVAFSVFWRGVKPVEWLAGARRRNKNCAVETCGVIR